MSEIDRLKAEIETKFVEIRLRVKQIAAISQTKDSDGFDSYVTFNSISIKQDGAEVKVAFLLDGVKVLKCTRILLDGDALFIQKGISGNIRSHIR